MKALTIKQPWASLIAHGIKDIENRTWKTNFRGRVYIHAGAKVFTLTSPILTMKQAKEAHRAHNKGRIGDADKLPYSAIIGEVDIIDCVQMHDSIWAEQNYDVYNWVLANAVLYDKPILNVKGKLSFWNYEY